MEEIKWIRDAFEAGYVRGHNDTVESCVVPYDDASNDYVLTNIQRLEAREAEANKPIARYVDILVRDIRARHQGTFRLSIREACKRVEELFVSWAIRPASELEAREAETSLSVKHPEPEPREE